MILESASGVLGLDLTSSCVGLETDLLAATPFVLVPAFFAALRGLALVSRSGHAQLPPRCLPRRCSHAALSGVLLGLAALPIYAALSGGYVTLAVMLFWVALSDGYGGYACCHGYSFGVFDIGTVCRILLCRLAGFLRLTEALPLLYERFGPACCDAGTGWAWGEHSAPGVVRDGTVRAVSGSSSQEKEEPPCTMIEVQGTDVFDIPMEEPSTCLALDELIPVTEVRQACETAEPAKSVQILVRGEHGVGVCKLAAEQSLADWYSGVEARLEVWMGTLPPLGGKILDSGRKVGSLGLGHTAEMVFHRRLLGGSFGGVVKGGWLPGTGEQTCSGKTDCWSTRYSCCRCGVPRYFDGKCVGQGLFGVGPGKGVGLQGQVVGAGMSGVRLVGPLGRDQTYVSGNPTHRRGNGRRGNGREGPVLGAGVGNGGNRVQFQEVPEDTAAGKVGVKVSGAAPKGQSKTQRDLILEAVEALEAVLGQGVGRFDSGAHSPASPGYYPKLSV